MWLIRAIFLVVFVVTTHHLRPFGLGANPSLAFGAAAGLAIIVFEIRLRKVTLKRLIGAAIGSVHRERPGSAPRAGERPQHGEQAAGH